MFDNFSVYKTVFNNGIADILNIVENIFYSVYIIFVLKFINRIRENNRKVYSNYENDLSWFRYLVYGILIIVFLDTIYSIYELNYPQIAWNIGNATAFSMVFLYCLIGYKGIFQSKILVQDLYNNANLTFNSSEQKESSGKKSNSSRFTEEEHKELYESLENLMLNDKIFMNPHLSLRELALSLNLSNKQTTDYINNHLGTNFHNLVNSYRIEEFKKRIKLGEYSKFTLETLALDCGFNSKSSFNRVFKKNEGITPSQYVNKSKSKSSIII